MEVLAGARVTEVAARYGVSRKQAHVWLNRYADGGLFGLVDRARTTSQEVTRHNAYGRRTASPA